MKQLSFQPPQTAVYSKGWKILSAKMDLPFKIASNFFPPCLWMFSDSVQCFVNIFHFHPWFCLLFLTNGYIMTSGWQIFVGKAMLEKIHLAFSFELYGS